MYCNSNLESILRNSHADVNVQSFGCEHWPSFQEVSYQLTFVRFGFLMKITRCPSTVKGCVPVVSVPGVTFDRCPIRSQQKLLEIPGDVSSTHLSDITIALALIHGIYYLCDSS